MTPPTPKILMEVHAFTVSDRSGPRLVVAREGEGWAVYRVTVTTADDGTIGRHLTIARDGVRPDRLPAVLLALVGAPAPDPTADKAQLAALGAALQGQRGDHGR